MSLVVIRIDFETFEQVLSALIFQPQNTLFSIANIGLLAAEALLKKIEVKSIILAKSATNQKKNAP